MKRELSREEGVEMWCALKESIGSSDETNSSTGLLCISCKSFANAKS